MTNLYRDFTSPAQIDAQYKASAAVPDAMALMRGYTERSREARERLRCTLDIPFGPTLDETLDIFPAERAGAPVFVFIHGGYWRAFTSKDFSFVALGLQPLGITTVVVNYSLCPKVTIDEISRQSRAAVAWTLRHAGAHSGDIVDAPEGAAFLQERRKQDAQGQQGRELLLAVLQGDADQDRHGACERQYGERLRQDAP